jgi:fusion protein PurCD
LILVDTKYEFGEDDKGNIYLIDEVHTPDSSRYWIKATYDERLKKGEEPEYLDKEFLRLWLKEQGFMGDGALPAIPHELIERMSNLYISTYEKLTGQTLPRDNSASAKNIVSALTDQGYLKGGMVQIVMGSESDRDFAEQITADLKAANVPVRELVASAHKSPDKVLSLVRQLNESAEPVVYITIAGRSNALSGVVAAQSVHPVIACPPFKDKADYLVNIHSSLQMPSSVPVLTVLEPKNAALAAMRILGR